MQTEEQKELIKKWIDALRSGKYKQGSGFLKKEDCYCCLGVLCELQDIPKDETTDIIYAGKSPYYVFDGDMSKYVIPYKDFIKWTGLDSHWRDVLIKLNDTQKYSFNEIADYIEKSFLGIEVQNAETN